MDPNHSPSSAQSAATSSLSKTVAALVDELGELEETLDRLHFVPGGSSGLDVAEPLRIKSLRQINDYLLPRITDSHAPLLAVVGGSTGAGKSTLVNSLLGEVVTRSGAVRPTTRTPVLVHHPSDSPWFNTERILPALNRMQGDGFQNGQHTQRSDALLLVPHARMPQGLALLDAPDIDSIADENRELAGQLLNAADLWLFVTTANRYADAVPWGLLSSAGERSITVSVILNRVPPAALAEIVPDLKRLLNEKSLDPSLLRVINEVSLNSDGTIPSCELHEISDWLKRLAENSAERQRIAAQTLRGALRNLTEDVARLTLAAKDQDQQVLTLEEQAKRRFKLTLEKTLESLHDGSLLRGEILARWQDYVGAGELLRGIEGRIGRVRDKVAGFFTGKPPATHKVEHAIETGLHTVLVSEISKACQDVDRQWASTPVGAELLTRTAAPRPDTALDEQASQVIRAWQKDVLEMIRTEGQSKRKTARIAAFGVNGIAVALMVVVFASTAGLTGLELGIAGGSAVVGQKLLEAIFGEDAVRRMAQRGSAMLSEHCQGLIGQYQGIYTTVTAQILHSSVSAELEKLATGLEQRAQLA